MYYRYIFLNIHNPSEKEPKTPENPIFKTQFKTQDHTQNHWKNRLGVPRTLNLYVQF